SRRRKHLWRRRGSYRNPSRTNHSEDRYSPGTSFLPNNPVITVFTCLLTIRIPGRRSPEDPDRRRGGPRGPVRQLADARARGRLGDGVRSVLRLLDSDPGRADDALPDSIARLHHQEDRRILDIVRRLLHERFVDVRVELVADLSVLFDAELRQRVDELVHMGLEGPGDIAVLTSELDLVEHGDQGFDDLDRAAEGRTLTFAVGTHPVCRVLGIDALEIREVSRGLRTRFGLFGLLGVLEARSIGRDVHPEVAGIGGLGS